MSSGKESSTKRVRNDYEEEEEGKPKKIPRTLVEKTTEKRLIVILEKASLETVKVGRKFELLNCDDHKKELSKHGRDIAAARPDISHQCLMMLLDSPLNRAGLLQVYIHTTKNVLIEINPHVRIPRTFNRFCGLMVQLLHKLSIHASDGPMKLMKVIKNPVTDHLPAGCLKIGTSYHSDTLVDVRKFAKDKPIVFVVGSNGTRQGVEVDYTEQEVSISGYPLSAALTCAKICTAFEAAWTIQ
ncbi:Ribosomal RNA small subunit methyltransferase NEP1 [Geodia barretti]|uniref:Ribosomal RNA small subunit methyltransferase NEP1 n=1 Tax=Geodia barretti TaxID=519541 RepID=A0AA35SMJ3_GEOBA|nr:Ribosomal RNA small subunit methyltransferase NEP1 [Geodia barretti]